MTSILKCDAILCDLFQRYRWTATGNLATPTGARRFRCQCYKTFFLCHIWSGKISWGCIFSHVRPFYEQAVSDLDPKRLMHRPVWVTHSSFIEGSKIRPLKCLSKFIFSWWLIVLSTLSWSTKGYSKDLNSCLTHEHKTFPKKPLQEQTCMCKNNTYSFFFIFARIFF